MEFKLPQHCHVWITDNAISDMRYAEGKDKRGAGLQLARTIRNWLSTRKFRIY